MKKKIIIISSIVIVLVIIGLFVFFGLNKPKFTLDSKYYNNSGLVEISEEELNKLVKNKESFVLFIYNDFCSFNKPCDNVFEDFSKDNNIEIVKIPFVSFKNTSLYKDVKYSPSIILINKGEVKKYLNPNSDKDYDCYQDEVKFKNWISKYIELEKGE